MFSFFRHPRNDSVYMWNYYQGRFTCVTARGTATLSKIRSCLTLREKNGDMVPGLQMFWQHGCRFHGFHDLRRFMGFPWKKWSNYRPTPTGFWHLLRHIIDMYTTKWVDGHPTTLTTLKQSDSSVVGKVFTVAKYWKEQPYIRSTPSKCQDHFRLASFFRILNQIMVSLPLVK